jgi:hypothetical protein
MAMLLLVAACALGRQWGITAYNNDMVDPILVQIDTATGAQAWLLAPQQITTLLRGPDELAGTMSVLHPETCALMATTSFDKGPAFFAIFHRGATGAGRWQIDMSTEEVSEDGPLASVSAPCES